VIFQHLKKKRKYVLSPRGKSSEWEKRRENYQWAKGH